jgi:hypothetical protein
MQLAAATGTTGGAVDTAVGVRKREREQFKLPRRLF